MIIKYLTLTGADDNIDPVELAKLSKQFPFLEWAILISEQREGTSRYPTKAWRQEFNKVCKDTHKAAHLCGKEILRRFAAEDVELASELKDYQRVQLNFNAKHTEENLLEDMLKCTTSGFYTHKTGVGTQFISQSNDNNEDITIGFFQAHRLLPNYHSVLFDASGGLGRSPKSWPKPFPNKLCGYAGGLGPDNILEELNLIKILTRQQHDVKKQALWIDMETKLRTNELFDLSKAQDVAEKVQHWITQV